MRWGAGLMLALVAVVALVQMIPPGSIFDRRAEPAGLTSAELADLGRPKSLAAVAAGEEPMEAAARVEDGSTRAALTEATGEFVDVSLPAAAGTKTGTIRVRLVDEDARLIEGVLVRARSREPVTTCADGRAKIDVFRGAPSLEATLQFRHFGHAADQMGVKGVRGETVDAGDFVLRAGGDVMGRVVKCPRGADAGPRGLHRRVAAPRKHRRRYDVLHQHDARAHGRDD